MKELKNDIKNKSFRRAYLLFGAERYLVEHYARSIASAVLDENGMLMNRDVFEGGEVAAENITDAANTLPFLSETRVVLVRDSGLFAFGRKNESDAMADYVQDIPDTTILIFTETEVDKRNRLYKKISSAGRAVQCDKPSEGDLIVWVGNVFKKKGKTIGRENSIRLLRLVMQNMTALSKEADKLDGYTGDRKEITEDDIKAVCSPSLETRVFDLVGDAASGRVESALRNYSMMIAMKESPVMILTLIARQFRMILLCKDALRKGKSSSAVARELGLHGFVADEYISQSRRFTREKILSAVFDCQETDVKIKTGLIGAETGVELLIIKYAAS